LALFPISLSLRRVDDFVAARGIIVSHETVRRWAEKFGRGFADNPARWTSKHDSLVTTIEGIGPADGLNEAGSAISQ
jgi:transposase-like protein